MAQAPGSSAVYLTSKAFPPEYEDVYRPRSQSSKQNFPAEKVLSGGADRRERMPRRIPISFDDQFDTYSAIGLLRVEYNGSCCMGTATIISRGNCLLTCAHNVVEYDGITKTFVYPTSAWFELRNNQIPSGSTMTKRYQVTRVEVYPPYFGDPTPTSGFDLALCWIDVPESDHTNFGSLSGSIPVAGQYQVGDISLVGFPGEYKGEKWGMRSTVPYDKREEWSCKSDWDESKMKEILVYDFLDSSPGQSGSPIIAQESQILGVHTGGSASLKKNWGTYITPTKLRWMADTLGSPWHIINSYNSLYLIK